MDPLVRWPKRQLRLLPSININNNKQQKQKGNTPMKKGITFYLEDSQQWDEAGMTKKDQDDLILGIWHWFCGEPSTEGMSVVTKALYLNYINRIEKSEDLSKVRSAIGKKGIMKRWHGDSKNSKANSKSFESDDSKSLPPTPTPTPSPTPSPSPVKESRGDTPQPPACVETKKVTRFVKPTEQEIIDYCCEKGYTKVNAADFIDYYESNGWMVGKNKMKDWKRTVSRWERMDQQGGGGNSAAGGKTGNNGMPVGMILHTKKDAKASDYEW